VQVVLFCNGQNCGELTAVLDEIGAYPDFEFVRIDCATDENREKCAGAGDIRETWRKYSRPTIKLASRAVHGQSPSAPWLHVELSLCSLPGFDKGEPRFFTNTAEAGIEPYGGKNTAADVKDLLDFRSNPIVDSNVVYFESKEHLNALVEKGAVMAKFHQTWCGHCKTMKKHFEKASLAFPKGGPISLVDIDCGYQPALQF